MNTYTVSFFGHREIDRPFIIEKRLEAVIADLIKSKEYVEFLVGRDGEFDQLVSSTVRRVARSLGYANTALVLVLPYMRAEYRNNEESYLKYYDEVEICEESASAYPAASFKIMRRLDIPHAEYSLYEDKEPYSRCDCFVTQETELITAWQICSTAKKSADVSMYRHFLNCCDNLEIKDAVNSIDQMLVLDYIIANEDRHLNNFGFLRNPDTLEWIGVAPVFDSGTSLGYNREDSDFKDFKSKPFKKTHEEQIKLVSSFNWIDFPKLDGIEDEIADILSVEQTNPYIDTKRCKAVTDLIKQGIDYIHTFSQNHENGVITDNISDDYKYNVKYYGV